MLLDRDRSGVAIKSLRIHIFLNLAVLLLIAMMLVNFIMLIVGQENLIQGEIDKATLLLGAIESKLEDHSSGDNEFWELADHDFLDRFLKSAGSTAVLVLDRSERQLYFFSSSANPFLQQLEELVLLAARDGMQTTRFLGTARGIFWNQKEAFALSSPLFIRGKAKAAAGVVIPLTAVYSTLRRTQHIVLIYTVINMLILALFGLYRMNLLVVKPVRRLVSRAESFRETEDDFFLIEKEDNAFSQLSKSLNRMLIRVSDSREKLKASVSSLESANRKLEETQKEMVRTEKLASAGRLSAGVAHEIGNPIGIIRGYLDLLRDPAIAESDREDYIRRTQTEIDRIDSIIRQLLDLSRPVVTGDSQVSVHEIIREISEVCLCQPMFACIRLDMELAAPVDTVRADANQLRQVFLNLMINATDAMTAGEMGDSGRLEVRTRVKEDKSQSGSVKKTLCIVFVDNGPGVAETQLVNIFDPFFTTKEPGKGTGLGLSVSYMLIDSMGGSIRAENQPGGGLAMTIDLPLWEGADDLESKTASIAVEGE